MGRAFQTSGICNFLYITGWVLFVESILVPKSGNSLAWLIFFLEKFKFGDWVLARKCDISINEF